MHNEFSSFGCNNVSLDQSHVASMCSPPSLSLKYSFDVLINSSMTFDSHVDLGCEDNEFDMLGGNIDNFFSLGYLCGYDASLNPYYLYLVDRA